jgi:subtilase family serine protease
MVIKKRGAIMNKSLRTLLLLGLIFTTTLTSTNTLAKASNTSTITKTQTTWNARPLIKVKRSSSLGPVGYTPSQIRNAYGLNQVSANGKGQTIAIVDSYGSPTIQNDLTTFSNQFGLFKANLTVAYPTGKPSKTDGGWALETAMDVEWAHAIAPNANILLCVAKSTSTNDLVAAIDYASAHGAQVVSNSWGGNEFSGESSYDSHFQHSGIVYVASAGDNGSGVEWPAVSPDVLSVGGTTLNIDSQGTYQSESGWSGSGGGTSDYELTPSYQNSVASIVGDYRGNPDISWDADPNTGVAVCSTTKYNNESGWFQVGGTSLGSPSWAGLIALFDQSRSSALSSFDAISNLYSVANSAYSTEYNDITTGSNGDFDAQPGYDLVTGIGTPKANALVPYITKSNSKINKEVERK